MNAAVAPADGNSLQLARRRALQHNIDVKKHLVAGTAALGLLLALPFSGRADNSWETDVKKAQEQAKSSNKLVFLDFTGSDWCGYCKRMQAEVFSKPEFQEYAAKNLILVELDFPRSKPQSAAVKTQNMKLASEYEIEGFPTLIVLSPDGKRVANFFGYMEGGPEAFIAAVEKARKS